MDSISDPVLLKHDVVTKAGRFRSAADKGRAGNGSASRVWKGEKEGRRLGVRKTLFSPGKGSFFF